LAKKKTKVGNQAKVVLKEYGKGKLRTNTGKKVTNRKQAFAIAMSEQRAAKKRGTSKRTWKGRTRIRPRKAK